MLRIFISAVFLLGLSSGHAVAVTFIASGTFTDTFNDIFPLTGTLTVDGATGLVSAASLQLVGEPWNILIGQGPNAVAPFYNLTIQTPIFNTGFGPGVPCTPTNGCHDTLALVLANDLLTLIANGGGAIVSGSSFLRDAGFSITLVSGSLVLAPVPLPAALPLFATGLGVIGLLAWRKKRKVKVIDA